MTTTRSSANADDLPAMSANSVANYSYDHAAGHFPGASGGIVGAPAPLDGGMRAMMRAKPLPLVRQWNENDSLAAAAGAASQRQEVLMANQERVVQVYAADLDQSLPLDKRLIWQSEPIFTDLNNNDLWFDLAGTITEVLAKHNEYRKTVRDKTIKDREQMLEAIRPRDLSVNITELAQFAKK